MRILMLDNEFPPLGGGMGTVNHALLKCYAKTAVVEIDLITAALGGREEIEQFADNIRIIKLPVWNKNIHHSTARELLLFAIQALPRSFKYHRVRPYDFCLAWSTLPAGAVALALKRLVSLPYAVWVSGPDIPGFEQRYRYLYPVLTPIIRSIWQDAKHVIAKCAGEVEMIKCVSNRINVDLIPNGVDLHVFQPNETIPIEGPLHIVCVARLIERKGQHHLIDAVKKLTDAGVDVLLSLVGTGDSQKDYERQVCRLNIQNRVRFIGYVPREEINRYYNAAHVFVLPSYNEGMSLAVLEAMAAGLPVIVTRTGGTAELVEDGVNGFIFDWADIKTLANLLRLLAHDRALAQRMGAVSRSRAMDYSWETIAARFLNLFHNETVDQSVVAQKSYS